MVQAQVDAAKVTEWNTLVSKNAVRLVPSGQAEWIKKHQPNHIMGSGFVITKKAQEDVLENGFIPHPDNPDHWKIKARFCLQGYLDPDLSAKAQAGLVQSPTMSQMGRTILFQLRAVRFDGSCNWAMCRVPFWRQDQFHNNIDYFMLG